MLTHIELPSDNYRKAAQYELTSAYILHGTVYSIFTHYMRTVQSNFRNLIIHTHMLISGQILTPYRTMESHLDSFPAQWHLNGS